MNYPASPITRRAFLKTSSASAAIWAASPWIAGAQRSANERINIGIIGCGERAQALTGELFPQCEKQNMTITAVCDVWQKNLLSTASRVREKCGTEPLKFTRFNELLASKDIDAVVIATPDFSHAPILIAALQAGKDVYVEKPMCIDIPSAGKALDLARTKKRIVQVGTQRRSDGHFIAAAKQLQSGVIGKVNRISAAMNVNQARWARPFTDCKEADVDWDAYLFCLDQKLAFDPKLLRRWQLCRMTSNGIPGLWMTHYSDAVHLLTGTSYTRSVVALGDTYVWKDGREHADMFQALLDYSEGFLFSWGMGLGNSAGVHFTIHGTQGTMDIEKWLVSSEGGSGAKFEPKKIEPLPTQGHMENWISCLRSRKLPAADIEFGHRHVVATVMAATAFETGRRQTYDPMNRVALQA
jgi:predicted dehydrogenase